MQSPAGKIERDTLQLAERLANDIAVAVLAPDKVLTLSQLAKHLRSTPERVESILPAMVNRGLVLVDKETITISSIDCKNILSRLSERLPLEQGIAQAAAMHATAADHARIGDAILLMNRSAQVGDIDGYMRADRALESAIGAASGLPADVERLVDIKHEFRRAWCAYNRLRDLNVPVAMRARLAKAILAKNPQAAVQAVADFIDYLKQSY